MTPHSRGPLTRLHRAAPLVASLLLACGAPQPITIGLAGPFEDPVGAPMLRAAQLAVAQLNAAGGIDGRPLVLLALDDGGHPDSAIAVAAALRDSPAVAVIGHLWSTTTVAAAPVYGSAASPLALLSPAASSPEIRSVGDHVFRLCPSDDRHGAALADWALGSLGARRAGILYVSDDYGRGVRRAFTDRFTARGGEVLGSFPYGNAAREAGTYLDRLADASPDALLLAGYPEDAAAILRLARARGLDMPAFGGDALEGIEASGPVAEGVYVTAAWVPDSTRTAAREFLRAYAAAHPEAPLPNQPAAATWDAVHLLAAILREAGADRAAVLAALAQVGIGAPTHLGVTGPIGFTPEGDLAQPRIAITVVREGRLVPAGNR